MKPLILSFFAVILAYSLFVDKEEEKTTEPATINTRSSHINHIEKEIKADSIVFYADKYVFDFQTDF